MHNQVIEGYEVSPQQKRLWALQQHSAAYRVHASILIEGPLDRRALREAFGQVVARHEALRTSFQRRAGMKYPLQVITERGEYGWQESELSGMSVQEQRERVEAERGAWFDAAQGAVVRGHLVMMGEEHAELEISVAAMCADAETLRNLLSDLARCYEAARNGETPSGEPEAYVQFSEWQNELMESEEEDAVAGRQYWSKQAKSMVATLPFERGGEQRRAAFTPQCESVAVRDEARLGEVAVGRGWTEAGWALACWKVLMWRMSGESELVVSEMVSGRKYAELKEGVGLYAKWLPVGVRIESEMRFSDLVEQIEERRSAARKWEEYFVLPESGDIGAQGAEAGVLYEYEDEAAPVEAGGVCFRLRERYACVEPFKLKLSVLRRSEALQLDVHFDAACFDAVDIRRLATQLSRLIESTIAGPDADISRLDIMSADERRLVVEEFNRTDEAFARTHCVHELIETQAQRTPGALAVVYEGEQVSYAELSGRTNRLARYLRDVGVGPEVRVGLMLERSVEMIVGLLGILKAGGAYVPLDPNYPKQRLSYMLQESDTRVLLTQQKLVKDFADYAGRVICLDVEREEIARASGDEIESSVQPDNMAYVIFTSGSTGKPKGVAIGHRQLLNYVTSVQERLALPAGGSFATVSTFSADLGNTVIFPALCLGGSLHVISQERASDPEAIADYFSRQRIDCLKIVPSHLAALLGATNPARVLPRQRLVLGGEASRWDLIEKVEELAPECLVMNHYGPTETTVGVLTYAIDKGQSAYSFGTVPLGRPIANTRVYVLDASLQPVPIKVLGELYIGGEGLARGYINRPELTVERFIPDPFGTQPGGRLYKTGDVACWLPEGVIEFFGRVDDQVKFHGFRVELGEIRSALNQHPQIRDSVVVARKDARGNDLLVAYYVARQELEVNALRSFLSESVIEEIIPNVYVHLKRLPLTLNGKVNFKALPSLEEARQQQLKRNYAAPRNATQEVLAGIWREVLGVERIGTQDNFFELGGHSLLATQIISRVREAFQVELPLRCLFETPNIEGIAASVEAALKADDGLMAPPINPVSREGELPLSFAQQRLWFLHQLEPDSHAYNVIGAVRLTGQLSVSALESCIDEIARRHEVLRTSFEMVDGKPSQVIAPELNLRLPLMDLSGMLEDEREAEARRLANEEVKRPFDLSQSPLFRVTLLRLSEEEHVLIYTMHHIVSDAWSLDVLVKEVAALYEAFVYGKPSPLAALPIQYADYAAWQREWLVGGVLEAHLSYWKQKLGGNLPMLQLPTDRPRPAVQSSRGAVHTFTIEPEMVKSLKELSRRASVTPFMTLLASFQVFLQKYTGQNDLVIGTDIANRNRAETESLIGFFINQLALRTDVSGNPTFNELLHRVREVTLGAYAHQDLPFDKLVSALKPGRSLSHTPLFQVLFVVQNAPASSLQLTNITLSPVGFDNHNSKFDIGIFLIETPRGMVGVYRYNTDLFDAATIERMTRHWQTLLANALAEPDARLNKLEMLTPEEKEQESQEKRRREESKLNRLKRGTRKAVDLTQVNPIKTGPLPNGGELPLVIEAAARHIDIVEWVKAERPLLDSLLARHGALLFRGFGLRSVALFERFANAICPELYTEYGDLPRQEISGRVYSSTPYPADQPILFHNESSHMHCWPMKIMFCCLTAPQRGGETPIVDCREVYRRLDPAVRDELARRRLMYMRNFTDGLDVSWQEFFRTQEPAEVERQCREMGIECEWQAGGGLRTKKVARAMAQHPQTGEMVMFNQVQAHHVSFLTREVRESLMKLFGEEGLPRNVYYGDGGEIRDEVMREILRVYEEAAVNFSWEEGDVLLLDNMLTAHGRRAYEGERRVVVAMGEMIFDRQLQSAEHQTA